MAGGETVTAPMLKKLHAMLNNAGMMDHKRELVEYFSNGRTSSSRELTQAEAINLFAHLGDKVSEQHQQKQSMDLMIKKMFALAWQMGYDQPRNNEQEHLEPKLRVRQNLQNWLYSKHSAVRKELRTLTYAELMTVLNQFERMYNEFKNKYAQHGR